jgi:hypothetical protein
MAGALFLAGAIPSATRLGGGRRGTIVALFVAAALLVGAFDLNLSRLDVGRSVKTLALVLQQQLQPGDEVMTYQTYYQDLPVYLERRVTTVDWRGELEFGASVEKNAREWLIDDAEFRRRWQSPRTKYLLLGREALETLRTKPPGAMRLVAQTPHAALIVNREQSR